MKAILEPIIDDCRAIYDLDGVMDRYWKYVDLMTKAKGELLPLGDFSPMGKRQKEFLNALIKMQAEELAREVCAKVSHELSSDEIFRVMLVVVDEPKNGWTQRYLTDADWRFSDNVEKLTRDSKSNPFDRWVTVNIWTTDEQLNPCEPSNEIVEQLIRQALYRAHLQKRNGYPLKLADMIRQEGEAFNFSGEKITLDSVDMFATEKVVSPLLECTDYPINFAALYGDDVAIIVGYEPLGLKPNAGFAFACARIDREFKIR